MIRINEPPKDYRLYCPFSYSVDTGVSDPGSGVSCVWDEGFGRAWELDEYGIRVTMEASHGMVVGSPDFHAVALFVPEVWDSSQPVILSTGATVPDQLWVKIEIDEGEEPVNAACEWAIFFREMRFYLDTGSGWVLKHTIYGPVDGDGNVLPIQSGFNFDKRQNTFRASVSAVPAVLDLPGNPTCDMVEFARQVSGGVYDAGWEYWNGAAWQTDDIILDTDLLPPITDPACECPLPLPGLSGTNSRDIHLAAFWIDGMEIDDLGIQSCPCVTVAGTSSWHRYQFTRTTKRGWSSVNIASADAGILTILKEGHSICNETDTADSDEETGTVLTHSEYERNISGGVGTTYCDTGITLCIEIGPIDPENPPAQCYAPPAEVDYCTYFGQTKVTWPYSVSCGSSSDGPHNTSTPDGGYLRAYTVEGDVWVNTSQFSIPLPSWPISRQVTSSADCSGPKVAVDHRSIASVVYIRGNDDDGYAAIERTSSADGDSWSEEEAITFGARHCANATDFDGNRIRAFCVPNEGIDGASKIYMQIQGPGDVAFCDMIAIRDESAADIVFECQPFDMVFAFDGQGRLYLHAKRFGEADTSVFWCTDYEYDPAGAYRPSFTRVGTGIASGSYPCIACGPDGEVHVAAEASGLIRWRMRAGDTNFSAEATLLDENGDPFEVEPGGFHFTFAYDTAARLVLTAVSAGTTTVREWQSNDLSESARLVA